MIPFMSEFRLTLCAASAAPRTRLYANHVPAIKVAKNQCDTTGRQSKSRAEWKALRRRGHGLVDVYGTRQIKNKDLRCSVEELPP
jgi:hypothetical protein